MAFWNRYALAGVGLLLAIFLIWYFQTIVSYILVSWVLSMVGQPLMKLSKIKVGKYSPPAALRAVMTLISFLLIIAILVALFVPLIIRQARNLAQVDYHRLTDALAVPLHHLETWLMNIGVLQQGNSTSMEQIQMSIFSAFDPARFADWINYSVSIAGNLIVFMFSTFFITFFFLKEEGMFLYILQSLVPDKYEDDIKRIVNESSNKLTNYFTGIVMQIIIITAFITICLSFLGVQNALIIGFFSALVNVIPYVGPLIGAVFGLLVTLSSNLDIEFYNLMIPLLAKVAVVFWITQSLDNYILQPYIFSRQLSVHPLLIFIAVLVGAQLGGIGGMVLAMPFFMIIRVISWEFFDTWKLVQRLGGGPEDNND